MNKEKLKSMGIEDVLIDIQRVSEPICWSGENSYGSWFDSLEASTKYIRDFHGYLYGQDEDFNKVCEIGYFKGSFFEAEIVFDDSIYSFVELCDMVDQTLYNMAVAITDDEGCIKRNICGYDENVLYIDRIYIEPKYQDCGIGTFLVKNLGEFLNFSINLYPHTIILEPAPQEKDEKGAVGAVKDEDIRNCFKVKLMSFYKKCGFKNIRGTNYLMKKVR